jgi:signal transduction histidine kinase
MTKGIGGGIVPDESPDVCAIPVVDEDTAPIAATTRLVCVAGVDLGHVFHLGEAPAVIGRGPSDVELLQKLDAIVMAVSGLAHDFNNALQVILIGLEDLEQQPSPETIASTVKDMKHAASGASRLAKQILNLGRKEPPAFDRVDVGELARETVEMTRRLLGARISVSASVDSEVFVRGSRDELQQVLTNLLLNARDAMPNGGELTVNAHRVCVSNSYATSGGGYVELTVTDTGMGMDEATRARAFEPFFTTKPPGKGTGLGLAMVHAIVQRHGGTVLVDSVPGSGTTFRVLMPTA